MMSGENSRLTDTLIVEVYRNKRLIDRLVEKDLVVNGGKASMAGLLNGVITTPFKYIAIGTVATTLSATQTALEGEVARKLADTIDRITTSVTNDTARLIAEFTATTDWSIVEYGVFDSSTGGTMLCRQTFTPKNLTTNDIIRVEYRIQIT